MEMRAASEATLIGRNLERMLQQSEDYRGNAKALSLDASLGETAVRDIIEGRSKKPRDETLRRIAAKLGRPVDDFYGDILIQEERPVVVDGLTRLSARQPRRDDLIPIRSAARGGDEQEMFLNDGPIGYTPPPAGLAGVRDAYAIYMVGDSMEPRYEQGWLLHVNPFRPPSKGRSVVVYKKNNVVLIKRFLGRTDSELILEQFNPRRKIRVPLSEVLEMHLIVGSDEEGG